MASVPGAGFECKRSTADEPRRRRWPGRMTDRNCCVGGNQGRSNQLANQAEVAGLFEGLDPSAIPPLTPRYNITPTQMILTAGRNAAGKVGAGFVKWGLVPSWANDDKGGAKLINARADGVAEKPSTTDSATNHSGSLDSRCWTSK